MEKQDGGWLETIDYLFEDELVNWGLRTKAWTPVRRPSFCPQSHIAYTHMGIAQIPKGVDICQLAVLMVGVFDSEKYRASSV